MLDRFRRYRRILTRSAEYRIRDAAYRFVPVANASPYRVVYHCCTWKSASQWVRVLLSDPSVYRHSGLRPYAFTTRTELEPFLRHELVFPPGTVVTPIYATYEELQAQFDATCDRALFVKRDPRDLVVSRYFSRLSAHPTGSGIEAWRQRLESISLEDGLIATIEDFGRIEAILRSWAAAASHAPAVMIARYETLTGENTESEWQRVFMHCGIQMTDQQVSRLLRKYAFERMSGGRKRGEENASHKYRKGVAGDWVDHFTPAVAEAFARTTGDLVSVLGYE